MEAEAKKTEGVDARRGWRVLTEKGGWTDADGASGELLVSGVGGKVQGRGGGIRFALREVRRGEGVFGVNWCCWLCP